MQKLSVLIFSKDDVEKALGLIKDLYTISDEIIVIDSSNRKQRSRFLSEKKRLKLNKLRLFYAVALGYPDPLRMYALSKCSNEWILLIDTDERLSEGLKHDTGEIIQKTRCSAFEIKRREGSGNSFTWQTRLFRKSKVEFKGLLHEHAVVDGEVCKLYSKDHYMEHRTELMKHSRMYEPRDYMDMRMFDAHQLLAYLPDVYLFITSFSIDFLHSISTLRTKRRQWAAREDYAEIREISKEINTIGIIKFLGLDREEVIGYLNRKYGNRKQGIGLLINLLKKRHEGKAL